MNEMLHSNLLLFAQYSENQSRDLLVAVIAVGLGLNIVYAAVTQHARCFELGSVRMLERNFGRANARYALIGIGSICVFMGAWLAAQSSFRKSVTRPFTDIDPRPAIGETGDLN